MLGCGDEGVALRFDEHGSDRPKIPSPSRLTRSAWPSLNPKL